jgi:hypothetical protein
MKTEGI